MMKKLIGLAALIGAASVGCDNVDPEDEFGKGFNNAQRTAIERQQNPDADIGVYAIVSKDRFNTYPVKAKHDSAHKKLCFEYAGKVREVPYTKVADKGVGEFDVNGNKYGVTVYLPE
jgi:hypothetical protein